MCSKGAGRQDRGSTQSKIPHHHKAKSKFDSHSFFTVILKSYHFRSCDVVCHVI
uniref:Uncharacterized protein n=1 Tax=Rhizophora mucronata TaxID=61149 RepID=A0A2P2JGX2_RHIMU